MPPDITDLLLQILEIVWINILLSGDNAIVIALACKALPAAERKRGVVLGAAAAVALRVAFTLLIVELLALPYVKLVGGLLLFWIAIRLVLDGTEAESIRPASTVWAAVRTIAIADAVMSLDNVVAIAAAAKGSQVLILFGLALSIPLIVFGSTLVLALLNRFPILVWAGAALLGWVAGELLASDPSLIGWLHLRALLIEPWLAPMVMLLVLAFAGLLRWRRAIRVSA